ncbi:MAG TPA: phosphate starvation-inducible protein PhoH, partial [Coleofasciculaceae cyanobacterium]
MAPLSIDLGSSTNAVTLAGHREETLKALAKHTGTSLVLRGQALVITGPDKAIALCQQIIQALEIYWSAGQRIDEAD